VGLQKKSLKELGISHGGLFYSKLVPEYYFFMSGNVPEYTRYILLDENLILNESTPVP
jgi:hypothetical protein